MDPAPLQQTSAEWPHPMPESIPELRANASHAAELQPAYTRFGWFVRSSCATARSLKRVTGDARCQQNGTSLICARGLDPACHRDINPRLSPGT